MFLLGKICKISASNIKSVATESTAQKLPGLWAQLKAL